MDVMLTAAALGDDYVNFDEVTHADATLLVQGPATESRRYRQRRRREGRSDGSNGGHDRTKSRDDGRDVGVGRSHLSWTWSRCGRGKLRANA